jgi:hypothetical protein
MLYVCAIVFYLGKPFPHATDYALYLFVVRHRSFDSFAITNHIRIK